MQGDSPYTFSVDDQVVSQFSYLETES